MTQRVAVVTGSNKGIGFAIVKGLLKRFEGVVYLTSRDEARGRAAVAALHELGLQPAYHQLDVTDRASVLRLRDHLRDTHGGLDLLVNNAAVANSTELYNTHEENKIIVDVNYSSILTIEELLFPLLRERARVLNISSDCGHLSNVRNERWRALFASKAFTRDDIERFVQWFLDASQSGTFRNEELADEGTVAAYRVAKVALSATTVLQQRALAARDISVNSLHPGLVRTDMTRGAGFFDPDQAAETPLYMLLDAPQSVKGAYVWYDRRPLDWYDYNADYYFRTKTLER